jgi:uncharacterized protein (DUF2344 family)
MESIQDLKIAGIDEKRPPKIRKEPYIDLVFKLNQKAPKKWCSDFNNLLSQNKFSAKINIEEGVYIEAWVRKPDEIVNLLEGLKKTVAKCTKDFLAAILAETASKTSDGSAQEAEGEQGRLNRIIAGLNFDAEPLVG